jgi:glycosyltransferase involved in cell wall biosynthesis
VAVEASGLANLEFKGHLSTAAVTQALGAARVVVVPSRWEEPGSLVALEAMAAGTPIVAYRSGGLGEYVEMSGAGLTVPPDPSALAAAVQRLMEDRDLWHETAAAGIEASQTMFSRESHTSAVLEVYERARAAQ